MSRKSSFSPSGTVITFHVFPPLIVLITVPPVPLAQTIFSFTTDSPRRPAAVLTLCFIHWAMQTVDSVQIKTTILRDFFIDLNIVRCEASCASVMDIERVDGKRSVPPA